jgi:hypothetical protein
MFPSSPCRVGLPVLDMEHFLHKLGFSEGYHDTAPLPASVTMNSEFAPLKRGVAAQS